MTTDGRGKKKGSKPAVPAVHVMTDLEQVRVLSDPLRIRILEELCKAEHTTKQVASLLGEKPTKLYHHVEALEKVGLIRLTRTQQNRGTLEKYYQAIARGFKTDSSLFSGRDESQHDEDQQMLQSIVSTILDSTAGELQALVAGDHEKIQTEGIVTFVEINGTQEELDSIQTRIKDMLEELQTLSETEPGPEDDPPARRYRLTLAFYPLDRMGDD